jgi:hypothetical protein
VGELNKLKKNLLFEISSSHGGEYDVQSCLLGCTAVDNHFTRQYNPEDSSELAVVAIGTNPEHISNYSDV